MQTEPPSGVLERRLDRWVEPEAVLAEWSTAGPAAVWFDRGHADSSEASFVGLASSDQDLVILDAPACGSVPPATSPADELATALRERLESHRAGSSVLGWWGWSAYELGTGLQGLPPAEDGAPLAAFAFVDRGIVFDHEQRTLTAVVLASSPGARAWLDGLAPGTAREAGRPAPPAPVHERSWTWRHGRAEYLDLVRRCQSSIAEGNAYQLCLTNEITLDPGGPIDPVEVYRGLRSRMPTRFGGVIRIGDRWLISGSPELYLAVDAAGTATTRPMKGTRRRGDDEEEDLRLAAELLGSEKERAENLMIVDLMRNDLSRVSRVGSVEVPHLLAVETYRAAHQLVSTVRSVLEVDAVEAMLALFPAGSMTGAPKRAAMQVLAQLEGGRRGVYSGVWGRLALDGTAELAVVIRSLVLTPDRVTIGTGGGITALSVPEEEWLEIELKAEPMLLAIGAALRPQR